LLKCKTTLAASRAADAYQAPSAAGGTFVVFELALQPAES
jgi:hypothetical protein